MGICWFNIGKDLASFASFLLMGIISNLSSRCMDDGLVGLAESGILELGNAASVAGDA